MKCLHCQTEGIWQSEAERVDDRIVPKKGTAEFMKKKIIAAMAACFLLACTGCSKDNPIHVPQITTKQVLKVDGKHCSLPKAKVYLANYQNLYGTVAGVDLWKQESQQEALKEYIKNLTISQLTKILSMDSLAKSRGIELGESDLACVEKSAKAYYDSLSEQELDYLEVSETDIQELYEDYALAQKLYKSLTVGVNSEVSDDEARIMDAMQIVVSDKKTAKDVKKALKEGGDFATIASSYNEAGEVKIQFGRGKFPNNVEEAAFALDNGEVTKCIEAKKKYYFIYCVNKFNEELTDANKIKIVQQREKTAFGDVYNEYSKTISKKMYKKTWDEIPVEHSDEITTDSFFAVYQEHCGDLGTAK